MSSNAANPPGRTYPVKIDDKTFPLDASTTSGRALLELAGLTPVETYIILLRHDNGATTDVGYDATVDVSAPGVERFITMKKQQTEG